MCSLPLGRHPLRLRLLWPDCEHGCVGRQRCRRCQRLCAASAQLPEADVDLRVRRRQRLLLRRIDRGEPLGRSAASAASAAAARASARCSSAVERASSSAQRTRCACALSRLPTVSSSFLSSGEVAPRASASSHASRRSCALPLSVDAASLTMPEATTRTASVSSLSRAGGPVGAKSPSVLGRRRWTRRRSSSVTVSGSVGPPTANRAATAVRECGSCERQGVARAPWQGEVAPFTG